MFEFKRKTEKRIAVRISAPGKNILPQIMDIHKAFASAWEQTQHFYKSEINPEYRKSNSGKFIAELDTSTNVVLLNFVIQGNVLRYCAVKVDLAFFFPVVNQKSGEIISEGIDMKELLRIKWSNIVFQFNLHNSEPDGILLCKTSKEEINLIKDHIVDDIGEIWISEGAIENLRMSSIPSRYLISYELVGVYYYAKYSNTTDIDCVLFAEIDNPHDPCAIKVLRWFPKVRKDNKPSKSGHLFFHLGHISRRQNTELHDYMVKNDCRILFAKCHNSQINIKGGVKYLGEEKLYYPLCLINIPVYE